MSCRPIWAEIDLEAIAHNISEIRNAVGFGPQIMAVVKANAYGHGAVEVAQASLRAGASWLGVARVAEGIELREAGIAAPILVLGTSPPECASELLAWDLRQTVSGLDDARALARHARNQDKTLQVHLKVDTGMGRLGLLAGPELGGDFDAAGEEVAAIQQLSGIALEGIFTHFACADSRDKSSASRQWQRFTDFLETLDTRSLPRIPVRHAANSASIIDLPRTHLDLVRAGIMLYGLYPSAEVDHAGVRLKPAMTVKARISQVKDVPAGFCVSYGSTYTTPAPTRIATVPVGYADGYTRLLSSQAHMVVHGQRVPVVGRVCMDQTLLDVGGLPEVAAGDEVVLLGSQGEACVSADELAELTGTINYEIVSTLMARVPRIFLPAVAGRHRD